MLEDCGIRLLEQTENMKNTPNREEQLIIDCLKVQGFDRISYEPNGNVPPDILLNNKIAIEVRRLNKNQIYGNDFKGLEQEGYAIYGLMKKIMEEISDKDFDKSALIGYFFNRPLPEKKVIKKNVSTILKSHKPFIHENREYEVSDNFKIRLIPSPQKLQNQYQYGMSTDGDSGGFIVGLIYENLKLIVAEKERKVKKYKSNYSEWWLAVVDTIGYGLTDLDAEQFHNLPKIENSFDRLLLVSAINSESFRYLYE